MKKQFVLFALLIPAFSSLAQQLSSSNSRAYYEERSRRQKTAGWILLGSGTVMAVGGAMAFGKSWYSGSYTETDIYGFVMLGGVASTIVSIPFFVNSGKNARKAATLSLKNQPFLLPPRNSICLDAKPVVTLTIKF
jgi:hypothetical protein